MKRFSHPLFIFLILLILTVAAFFAIQRSNPARQRYSARGLHSRMPVFKKENVASVEISWRKIHSTMIRKNDCWYLRERNDKPASAIKINQLLDTLSTLAPVKELTACSPEILKELHLIDNDPKHIPGVRVVLKDKTGQTLYDILLGRGHFVRKTPGLPPATEAEGRYIKIAGKVYLIPLVFENCHPVPQAWVEPLRLNELQKALSITVSTTKNGKMNLLWSVSRKSTAHPFTMMYPRQKKAENRMLSGLAAQLSRPFSKDYHLSAFDPLCKERIMIRCADGFTYILSLYDAGKDQDAADLRILFDPGKIIAQPGETPNQLAARRSALAKRFANERFYTEKQLFTISKELSQILTVIPEKKAGQK